MLKLYDFLTRNTSKNKLLLLPIAMIVVVFVNEIGHIDDAMKLMNLMENKDVEPLKYLSIKTIIRNHPVNVFGLEIELANDKSVFENDFVNNFINFVNKPPMQILSKLMELSIKMRI